jgi:hypothetical protein
MFFDQNDQYSRNEKLIGNRVEQFSEIGDLISATRKVPVENIRKRCDEKNCDGEGITTTRNGTMIIRANVK